MTHITGNCLNDPDTWGLPKEQRKLLNPHNYDVEEKRAANLLGTAFQEPTAAVAVAPAPVAVEDEPALIARIKALATALKTEGDDQSVGMAREAFAEIRDAEYARPDGGRLSIKSRLSAYGFKRPEA